MSTFWRFGLIIGGFVFLVVSFGYYNQAEWAIATWPLEAAPFAYTFLAAIQAAIGAALLWFGFSQEWAALTAGALNLMVMMAGFGLVFSGLAMDGQPKLWPYVIGAIVAVLLNIAIFVWSHRHNLRQRQRAPRLLLFSFALFGVTLLVVGISLLMGEPSLFPWTLNRETAVLFGWIFIGDAFYFLYGVWRPYWGYMYAPLCSFLAYDLVLIGRAIAHFENVSPEWRLNLGLYTAVLLYSAGLAIYYLLLNPQTRPFTFKAAYR